MNVLFILFVQDFKAIHPTVVDEFQSSLRYDDTLVIHREIYWILHMWRSAMLFPVIVLSPTVSHQERMVQSLMQRHPAARQAGKAGPTRHVPTQLWRCWVGSSWCCVCLPPGWAPLSSLSWPSSHFPAPSSSPGSVVTGTSSSSPSTTRDMLSSRGRSRPQYKNSGTVSKHHYVFK